MSCLLLISYCLPLWNVILVAIPCPHPSLSHIKCSVFFFLSHEIFYSFVGTLIQIFVIDGTHFLFLTSPSFSSSPPLLFSFFLFFLPSILPSLLPSPVFDLPSSLPPYLPFVLIYQYNHFVSFR